MIVRHCVEHEMRGDECIVRNLERVMSAIDDAPDDTGVRINEIPANVDQNLPGGYRISVVWEEEPLVD